MNTQVLILMKPAAVPAQSFKPAPFGALQRKCACGGSGRFSGECADCKKKKLQRSVRGSGPETAPPIVHDVLRSSGQPLDGATRAYFEPRFGHDFSRVRIHADARANESAQSVNALAYTVGRDVVFGAGQYQPGAASGQRLLAHELTHVKQQNGGASFPLRLASSTDPAEREAEKASFAMTAGSMRGFTAPAAGVLQRQETKPSATGGSAGGGATPAASGSGVGSSLCTAHPDELYYKTNPLYCQDTASTGSMHKGFRCYREIPTGSGCPAGKHVCFDPATGKCNADQSHIDSTVPSISRDSTGMCDLSWLGWCSIEHAILDVVPDLLAKGSQAQIDCIQNCQKTQPTWMQGLCMQGCPGVGAF